MAQVLAQPETLELGEAKEAFRALIRSVVVKPLAERGAFDITVETELAPLMQVASLTTLGAGTRNQRFLRLVEVRGKAA